VKRKKTELEKQKDELWKWFSKYIRLRDKGICITCGKFAEGSGYHAGHFIASAAGGLILRYNEENVHGQCYNCNINLGGNQYEYAKKLGLKKAEALLRLKHKVIPSSEFPFLEKIVYYKDKVKELESNQ
jgi:5-methylcytosine-specific restriction endonuclease McrA